VNGINLISLVWTDENATIPIDFCIYEIDQDGKTKNDHFKEMLTVVRSRGFKPEFVMFDSWYGSIGDLKLLRELCWHLLTRLKKNRLINPDWSCTRQIHEIEIPSSGRIVHLKEYGMIRVFFIILPDNEREFLATDVLDLDDHTEISQPQLVSNDHTLYKIHLIPKILIKIGNKLLMKRQILLHNNITVFFYGKSCNICSKYRKKIPAWNKRTL
jgi:hypothetical protein